MSVLTIDPPTIDGSRHSVMVGGRALWYEFTGKLVPTKSSATAAAVGLLPWAMANTEGLHINACMDRSLLANLEEFRDYWVTWRPDLFASIPLTAAHVEDANPGPRAAVTAFSGGVDATYLVMANASGLLGHRSIPIESAILVQGFDVPIDDPGGFEKASASTRMIAESMSAPVSFVRTNWRDFCPDFEMCFAAGIASVLHSYGEFAGVGLLASGEQYDMEELPWGSNGTSNPMLGGAAFQVRTVGAGASRTQKCALIATSEVVRRNLRVCWAGRNKGENCGRCEKCVRTKLNFLAAGVNEPIPALGHLTRLDIARLRARNEVQLGYLREILRHDLPPRVRLQLRRALFVSRWNNRARRFTGPLRKVAIAVGKGVLPRRVQETIRT